jgi:hypothetical protein
MEKAQGARRLVAAHSQGVLCTNSAKREGYPFGSVTPYALDGQGRPLFLVSSMAVHTKNLAANPKAALLVSEETSEEGLLAGARANLLGAVTQVPDDEEPAVREAYLARHPAAAQWADFGDFAFYRMEIAEIYYVGGFGMMGWVSSRDYGTNPASGG